MSRVLGHERSSEYAPREGMNDGSTLLSTKEAVVPESNNSSGDERLRSTGTVRKLETAVRLQLKRWVLVAALGTKQIGPPRGVRASRSLSA